MLRYFCLAYKMIHEISRKNINIYPGFIQEETKDGKTNYAIILYQKIMTSIPL